MESWLVSAVGVCFDRGALPFLPAPSLILSGLLILISFNESGKRKAKSGKLKVEGRREEVRNKKGKVERWLVSAVGVCFDRGALPQA